MSRAGPDLVRQTLTRLWHYNMYIQKPYNSGNIFLAIFKPIYILEVFLTTYREQRLKWHNKHITRTKYGRKKLYNLEPAPYKFINFRIRFINNIVNLFVNYNGRNEVFMKPSFQRLMGFDYIKFHYIRKFTRCSYKILPDNYTLMPLKLPWISDYKVYKQRNNKLNVLAYEGLKPHIRHKITKSKLLNNYKYKKDIIPLTLHNSIVWQYLLSNWSKVLKISLYKYLESKIVKMRIASLNTTTFLSTRDLWKILIALLTKNSYIKKLIFVGYLNNSILLKINVYLTNYIKSLKYEIKHVICTQLQIIASHITNIKTLDSKSNKTLKKDMLKILLELKDTVDTTHNIYIALFVKYIYMELLNRRKSIYKITDKKLVNSRNIKTRYKYNISNKNKNNFKKWFVYNNTLRGYTLLRTIIPNLKLIAKKAFANKREWKNLKGSRTIRYKNKFLPLGTWQRYHYIYEGNKKINVFPFVSKTNKEILIDLTTEVNKIMDQHDIKYEILERSTLFNKIIINSIKEYLAFRADIFYYKWSKSYYMKEHLKGMYNYSINYQVISAIKGINVHEIQQSIIYNTKGIMKPIFKHVNRIYIKQLRNAAQQYKHLSMLKIRMSTIKPQRLLVVCNNKNISVIKEKSAKVLKYLHKVRSSWSNRKLYKSVNMLYGKKCVKEYFRKLIINKSITSGMNKKDINEIAIKKWLKCRQTIWMDNKNEVKKNYENRYKMFDNVPVTIAKFWYPQIFNRLLEYQFTNFITPITKKIACELTLQQELTIPRATNLVSILDKHLQTNTRFLQHNKFYKNFVNILPAVQTFYATELIARQIAVELTRTRKYWRVITGVEFLVTQAYTEMFKEPIEGSAGLAGLTIIVNGCIGKDMRSQTHRFQFGNVAKTAFHRDVHSSSAVAKAVRGSFTVIVTVTS